MSTLLPKTIIIGQRGTITIPKIWREQQGFKEGHAIRAECKDGKIILDLEVNKE